MCKSQLSILIIQSQLYKCSLPDQCSSPEVLAARKRHASSAASPMTQYVVVFVYRPHFTSYVDYFSFFTILYFYILLVMFRDVQLFFLTIKWGGRPAQAVLHKSGSKTDPPTSFSSNEVGGSEGS